MSDRIDEVFEELLLYRVTYKALYFLVGDVEFVGSQFYRSRIDINRDFLCWLMFLWHDCDHEARCIMNSTVFGQEEEYL